MYGAKLAKQNVSRRNAIRYGIGGAIVIGAVGGGIAYFMSSSPSSQREGVSAPPPSPQMSEREKMVEAAKKEGQVVVYTSGTGSRVLKEIDRSFKEKYSIQTEYVSTGPGTVLIRRAQEESKAGKPVPDVAWLTESPIIYAVNNNMLAQYTFPEVVNFEKVGSRSGITQSR